MSTPDRIFDAGAQTERTLLAWQRTALALAVGSAIGIRVLAVVIGGSAIVVGVAGLALAALASATAWRRYRRAHRALTGGAILPGAGPVVGIVAAATVMLGLAALAVVIAAAVA